MVVFPSLVVLVLTVRLASGTEHKLYDFEEDSDVGHFTAEGRSTREVTSKFSKGGTNSLLWSWPANTRPSLKLKFGLNGPLNVKHGGIKFWMYRKSSSSNVMQLTFRDEVANAASSAVNINLNFQGWRGVWIAFREFGTSRTGLGAIDVVKFSFPVSLTAPDKLYIDLLQMVDVMSAFTRDKVVPKVSATNYNIFNEKQSWFQTLRWSQYPVPAPSAQDKMDIPNKIAEIEEIEKRLDNWYGSTQKGLHDDGKTPLTRSEFEKIRQERWNGLLTSIDEGANVYDKLTMSKDGSKIIGPPLFPKTSKHGQYRIRQEANAKAKFSTIMENIILPLALEYNLRSRDREIKSVAKKECANLISQHSVGLANAAGANTKMKEFLRKEIQKLPTNLNCKNQDHLGQLEGKIKVLNEERLRRLMLVLDYVEEQGWTDGSSVGTLDHEMNKNGAGYMHGLFLLRKGLRKDGHKLSKLLKAMKWYNDFNEIYQPDSEYVFDGTTADRMRTILLYRLMTILMMPSAADTPEEETKLKAMKIRDMRCLKSWAEHVLKINKGLAGVIKPDYTGFHHSTFYGPAYVPHALHNAALMQYLLEGTTFQLSNDAKKNLRNALEVMRIVAVKYSTPNSICGRFPNYNKAILAETTPAYAYISYTQAMTLPSQTTHATLHSPEMFLRLYKLNESAVSKYMKLGKIKSHIFYLNSIGALDILDEVKQLSDVRGKVAEASPTGHWSKNFAALSVHRRYDWAVTAKGFHRYVWDFESGKKNNLYGLFQSHGYLQISNSEASLKSYDVRAGWDWTRISGATTINLEPKDLLIDKMRYYNPKRFAGGVSLRGVSSSTPQNGVFGMEFKQPDYYIKDNKQDKKRDAVLKKIKFTFKKSFFFIDHLIVCVGSNIKLLPKKKGETIPYYSQTTLFQDKRVKPSVRIKVGSSPPLNLLNDYTYTPASAAAKTHIDLQDTRGNIYRVLSPDNLKKLHVTIKDQKSMRANGKAETNARYATAWLEHTRPTGSNYIYGILIKGGNKNLLKQFTVTKSNSNTHVVEFKNLPRQGTTTTGYSIFKTNNGAALTGPINNARAPCTIMTEETPGKQGTPGTLHIALSNPAFKFEDDPVMKNRATCKRRGLNKDLKPKNLGNLGPYLMFCVRSRAKNIQVTLRKAVTSLKPIKVWVDDQEKTSERDKFISVDSTQKIITFRQLANGLTTEAVFNI